MGKKGEKDREKKKFGPLIELVVNKEREGHR